MTKNVFFKNSIKKDKPISYSYNGKITETTSVKFIQSLKAGDKIYTLSGSQSDHILLAAYDKGVKIRVFPTNRFPKGEDIIPFLQSRRSDDFYEYHREDQEFCKLRFHINQRKLMQRQRIAHENRFRCLLTALDLISDDSNMFDAEGIVKLIDSIKKEEKSIEKHIAVLLKTMPVYNDYFLTVKGIGPVIAGSLIAWLSPIERFGIDSPQKLWAYCGLHTVCSKCRETKCDCNQGRASLRRAKGRSLTWSPALKELCYNIGISFVKQKGRGCIFNTKYFMYKERLKSEMESGKREKINGCHLESMARRYAVKQFLKDMWINWNRIEGRIVKNLSVKYINSKCP